MQPRPSHCTHCMFVVERPPGRLGKRGLCVEQSCAVGWWCSFRHLRFATPARGPLHDSYGGVIGHLLGPGRDRARLTPQDTGQSRTMSAHVPPSHRQVCSVRSSSARGRGGFRRPSLVGAAQRTRPGGVSDE